MHTSCTQKEVKENMVKSFCLSTGHLRIVIATIAFSMILDVPDIQQVRLSDDFEGYI